MNERDIEVLKSILKYCEQIDEANKQYDSDKEAFEENSVYRNAVAMCVLQIGELVKRLSEGYKLKTNDEIPWHQIQGLRNVVAHDYGKIDAESLWETVTEDIPTLYEFCSEQIKQTKY
ncbi:MAG: DUF86 domain-containing protein [Firmicutes bacterium]|nr:DUF86 domain-containing protein [[Eubacterium] siraeum]MCM1487799.1 DUF86 domain-containing protein [Bacillota bacterium]